MIILPCQHSLPAKRPSMSLCPPGPPVKVHAPGTALAAALPLQRPEERSERGRDVGGAAEGLAVRGAAGRRLTTWRAAGRWT